MSEMARRVSDVPQRRSATEARRTATREDVLTAAREILDEEGIGALTMANVASRVGFTTMAVYRHVRSRDDMLEGVLDLVLHEISDDSDPDAPWLEGVDRWMRDVRAHLVAHPWAATSLGSRTEMTAAWTATVEVLTSHLARSGLSTRNRTRAAAWVTRITVGIVIQEVGAPIRMRGVTDDSLFDDVVAQTREYLEGLT
jgi:AcrR family transcriptional regulator